MSIATREEVRRDREYKGTQADCGHIVDLTIKCAVKDCQNTLCGSGSCGRCESCDEAYCAAHLTVAMFCPVCEAVLMFEAAEEKAIILEVKPQIEALLVRIEAGNIGIDEAYAALQGASLRLMDVPFSVAA